MVLSGTGRSGARFSGLLFTLLLVHGCAKNDWENHWEETISGAQVTAEELILRVEAFLAEEPPMRYASEARFTIGFTWAVGLEKYDEARKWFEELLEEDPDCEWADDARWMLENMEKGDEEILPLLDREEPPPR